MRREFDVNAEN